MALVRLQPRPTALYVSRGRTVLATSLDGQIRPEQDIGLFVRETRLLSRYEYRLDGQPFEVSALSNVEQHTWLGYYFIRSPGATPRDADAGSGMVPLATEETLELRVQRRVGEGLHEDLLLTNFGESEARFTLALLIEGDFVDYVESAGNRRQHGRSEIAWDADKRSLMLRYEASSSSRDAIERFSCRLDVRVNRYGGPVDWDAGALRFPFTLAPAQSVAICLAFIPAFDGSALDVPAGCGAKGRNATFEARTATFLDEATHIDGDKQSTDAANVFAALGQARSDLVGLRLFDLDRGGRAWVPAAGVPVYIALFGRDTLTAAWQSALLGPEMMQGALLELARWVGKRDDPWRDEQPGKLLHEAHTGPASALELNPRARYYGSITTSGFYAAVLSELWHWTGDRTLVERLLPVALGGLDWLDRDGDINADGLFEYLTRSSQGVKHQAWKDSRDAMVDDRGQEIEPPIATCEEQAFVYVAKLQLAEVCWWLDQKDTARRLWREAHELKARFNERFWMASERFFAMGLGPDGQPIRSISSNPGHCLAAGIVEEQHVAATADRLMADDLFSGWGIRTLSSQNPAYNPYSYHRGSVWPVEQGSFALGFLRYGLHDHLQRLARGVFEAAAVFEHCRLPELFSGHARTADQPFPALYPQGNSPQAWSASTLFLIVQAMLGVYPYAPLHTLFVDPHLPAWLPGVTLRGLRVGDAAADLTFQRDEDGRTDYRVLDKRGTLHVIRQPSPWSLTAGAGERIRDVIESLLPGH